MDGAGGTQLSGTGLFEAMPGSVPRGVTPEGTPPSVDHNAHYDKVATFYAKAWFYKPDSPFQKWYVANVVQRLGVEKGERVVDFGGGDGVFSQSMHRTYASLSATTLVVDPSPGMLEKVCVTCVPSPLILAPSQLSTLFCTLNNLFFFSKRM